MKEVTMNINNSIKKLLLPVLSLIAIMALYNHFSIKCAEDLKTALLTRDNKPNHHLTELLSLLGVNHDGTLASIVASTQKQWLRNPDQERWHMAEISVPQKERIKSLLGMLYLQEEIKPIKKNYDYCLMLGATVQRVRTRFAYLLDLHKQGVTCQQIIMLGGKRRLDEKIESATQLLDAHNTDLLFKKDWQLNQALPTNETEMMRMVVDQTDLPADFAKKIIFIDTPMQSNGDGAPMRRPNTGDTIKQWLKSHVKPGSCLAISNQPYIGYQDSVIRTFLPESFSLETVGPRAEDDSTIAATLDSIARWLYQENIRLNIK